MVAFVFVGFCCFSDFSLVEVVGWEGTGHGIDL